MSLQNGAFKKAYFEITNVCNAACTFCPGNSREPHFVSDDEFDTVLLKLKGRVEYLYFHLMGEPLLHPSVSDFACRAKACGFKVMITTNGILSREVGIPLVSTGAISKISISLHSHEANSLGISLDEYITSCLDLAETAAENKTVCALRLWNLGAKNDQNDAVLCALRERFGSEWAEIRSGFKIAEYIFLEYGERFDWPDEGKFDRDVTFCHALRNQIGILSNGTVVPCCLDAEGRINLGNLCENDLDGILSSERAKALYDGFSAHMAVEKLCQSCGYANRFK
ncbi:MAG: SPASM domain-containing protein [Clostridia bacterium]|nr:SPASM domain-containing protein [Clostridia bacterium]